MMSSFYMMGKFALQGPKQQGLERIYQRDKYDRECKGSSECIFQELLNAIHHVLSRWILG